MAMEYSEFGTWNPVETKRIQITSPKLLSVRCLLIEVNTHHIKFDHKNLIKHHITYEHLSASES